MVKQAFPFISNHLLALITIIKKKMYTEVLSRPEQPISNSVQGCAEKIILYENLDELSHNLLKEYRQHKTET